MDEELKNTTTEETLDELVVESEIQTEDLEPNVEIEEVVELIEVEIPEEINIEMDETVGWVGGDSTRHYSLYGRDEPDQHPITSIIGLREELNDIEALDVVYSNKRNQADYYLWEDKNILQENRVGYFVSACADINEIKLCTSDNDIFGVTVDSAGFIGAQDDIARDIKYGLVVTTGVVHVRCESSVDVGDYVISNDYGYATSNKNGYKVVGRHLIDGVEYAEITLSAPINRICKLSDDVENVNQRMDDAETNIVAAMNVANAAYNKAEETNSVSEEAVKNALEALNKSNETLEKTDGLASNIASANEVAAQARAIAESAVVSADAIRKDAEDRANQTLADVNDLIKDLEPITTWEDPESGNVGAEYFTEHITNNIATKTEVQVVETKTEDNKSAIEKNAEKFQALVSSVDKYSVGEYSQSYGLTYEQAVSILKEGMIYVPTKHKDTSSHSEIFSDTEEENWFTPGGYYEWNINDQGVYDWIEYKDSVAFFSEEPTPIRTLQYWYIDSNEAPEEYESYALYIWEDNQWNKVNILAGNANNRVTSMIRQTADNVALEVTNARGEIAGLDARLTEDEKSLSLVVKDGGVNSASIIMAINDDGSSVNIEGDHIVLNGATTNGDGSFQIHKNGYMIATGGTIGGWNITDWNLSSTVYNNEGKECTVSLINTSDYYHSGTSGRASDVLTVYDASNTNNPWPFSLWKDGTLNCAKLNATGGTIGGWTIGGTKISANNGSTFISSSSSDGWAFYSSGSNGTFRVGFWGDMYCDNATIKGHIEASTGNIGGWNITSNSIERYTTIDGKNELYWVSLWSTYPKWGHFLLCRAYHNGTTSGGYTDYFDLRADGTLIARNATIYGHIEANSGTFKGTLKAGSIIDMNNPTFSNSTDFLFYNGVGWLRMDRRASKTDRLMHPWISGININNYNGINFYTGESYTTIGELVSSIDARKDSGGDYGTSIIAGRSSYIQLVAKSNQNNSLQTAATIYLWDQIALTAGSGSSVWAEGNGLSKSRVTTAVGAASSRILKENIVDLTNQDYEDAYNLLKELKMYEYDYKYKLYNDSHQYGFIIDELEELNGVDKFFRFDDMYAKVEGDKLDPSIMDDKTYLPDDLPNNCIKYKQYDSDVLDKYLLTVCKALQQKIEKLETLIKGE